METFFAYANTPPVRAVPLLAAKPLLYLFYIIFQSNFMKGIATL
nr:MAG TPA: hypothetical protein [Caudoviricetes sp.]DAM73460.1 MAG TPA: hypothetical protein [Caudoviricetes sp.]DAZ19778.1 MAG TPA: hypothetical protein [Caudoviricetes sp.]